MNLPDITLFFQMIHFLIAYAIFKRFVFAPSLMILEKDEERNKRYNQKLHDARIQLHEITQQHSDRWRFIKQSLIDMSPMVGMKKCFTGFKVTTPVQVEKIKLTVDEQESIKNTLHKKLLDF
jgi:F0F1-type ATP synthase membrane subunit b/b'